MVPRDSSSSRGAALGFAGAAGVRATAERFPFGDMAADLYKSVPRTTDAFAPARPQLPDCRTASPHFVNSCRRLRNHVERTEGGVVGGLGVLCRPSCCAEFQCGAVAAD